MIWFLLFTDARGAVGGVALGADALVPVVIGRGRILGLDGLEPGIFARGLIEMPMNADVAFGWCHAFSIAGRQNWPCLIIVGCCEAVLFEVEHADGDASL